MDQTKYSGKTLEQMLRVVCRDGTLKEALPHYDLRDDGLWLCEREPFLTDAERAFFEWHPREDIDQPALPVPFTTYDLATFFLDGGGYFFLGAFDGDEALDEDALAALGNNAGAARKALQEAHRLYLMATARFGSDAAGVRQAANWLLNYAHRELSAAPAPGVVTGPRSRWTPERLEELRAYRAEHGTKQAAVHFGVTGARVRALLPSDKPQPKGYSAFNPRLK